MKQIYKLHRDLDRVTVHSEIPTYTYYLSYNEYWRDLSTDNIVGYFNKRSRYHHVNDCEPYDKRKLKKILYSLMGQMINNEEIK